MNTPRGGFRILLLLSFFVIELSLTGYARAEESHPGLQAEAVYAEALLHYNQRKMAEAARALDEVLKLDPNHLAALEMRALTLKIQGDDKRSVEIYKQLIKVKPKSDHPPYHF